MVKELITTTPLGFFDITEELIRGDREGFYKYDVIRNIRVNQIKRELHGSPNRREEVEIGYFFVRQYKIRGRIFPLDEIIELNREYDIIIQSYKKEAKFPPFNIDAQIYHDFNKGERIKVRVSRLYGCDPFFILFNHIRCFVNNSENGLYEKIKTKDILLVEVSNLNKKEGKLFPNVTPLEILARS